MKRLLTLLSILVFVACTSQSDSANNSSKLVQGQTIAAESFSALSAKLMTIMAEDGPEGAVEFCSLEALPITDSLTNLFGATIKRTALKYRNSENNPDSTELAALIKYSEEIGAGNEPKPYVILVNGKERFFAPIPTKALCLSCHGVPGVNMTESVVAKINKVYPNDMAVGFQVGDLRGIWSITFND